MIKFSRDRPHDLKGLLVYDYRAALNTLTNGKFEQV